jgi:tight adherence protein B
MLAGIAFALVTSSLLLLCWLVFSIWSKAYERYRERYSALSLTNWTEIALFIDRRQTLILGVASASLLGALGWWLNPVVGIPGLLVGLGLPSAVVKHYRALRIRKFNAQLVDALQAMASAFRAGLSFSQAMDQLAKESAPPLSQEFGLFVKEVKLGVSIDQALNAMAQRVGSDDFELVAVSTNISRSMGGNMSEMFETISATVRERFRLEGKIDAITSQGKLQGWMVAAMPLILGAVLNYMRPDLMGPMLHHAFGYLLILLICILETLGILWIRRIVKIEV